MKLIDKIRKKVKQKPKSSELGFPQESENKILISNCTSYTDFYEKCLEYYFKHLNELKGKYFDFFRSYLKFKIHDRVTDKQIVRYLNGEIKFEDIKTYWQEIAELQDGFDGDIFNYIIGYDSYSTPIFDEVQINKLKYENNT